MGSQARSSTCPADPSSIESFSSKDCILRRLLPSLILHAIQVYHRYTWFRLRSISASTFASTALLIQRAVGWTLGEFTMMLQLLSMAPLVGDLNAWKRL